ncbi:MAG: hypothetical protein LBR80_00010 [Deltaproteobacteria bacterium]|jgi:hypothetical protein|nr:hypothetical protein [Deltaproteobacteria bacterium]
MFLTFALFTILFTVLVPALPSFGADGEGAGGHGVGSPHQGKDGFLKYLADRDFRSFLLFLGKPPQLVEGAVQLKTELTGLGMGIRRPDRLYRSGDGSFLILEFQSTADDLDIFRFLVCSAMLAAEYKKEKSTRRSMSSSSTLAASENARSNPTPTRAAGARVAFTSSSDRSFWGIFPAWPRASIRSGPESRTGSRARVSFA